MTEAEKELQAALRFYEVTAQKFPVGSEMRRRAGRRMRRAVAAAYGLDD